MMHGNGDDMSGLNPCCVLTLVSYQPTGSEELQELQLSGEDSTLHYSDGDVRYTRLSRAYKQLRLWNGIRLRRFVSTRCRHISSSKLCTRQEHQ